MQEPRDNVLGKVYLVGAGPGDPRLITVRGRDCLALADLILYDYLINPALLDYASPGSELVCLGHPHIGRMLPQEEINRRMVEGAQAGRSVVRLKSGDPYLFGRGAEEVEALRAAGIPYEVVPGVTSALAAAASVGIPITHREFASAVALVTGRHRADQSGPEFDYQALGRFPGTVIIYMGVARANEWSEALIRGGKPPDTPVLIVRRVTWPDQQVVRTTLAEVAQAIRRENLRPPALIVVGEAAGLTPDPHWPGG